MVIRIRRYACPSLPEALHVGRSIHAYLWAPPHRQPWRHHDRRRTRADRSTTVRTELVAIDDATLEIGDRSFLNYGTSICATGLVRIGRDCMLGTYAMILDNDFEAAGGAYKA